MLPTGSRVRLPRRKADRVTLAAWARLARAAEESGASLLLLGEEPMAGSFAAATVTFHRRGARWAQNSPRAPKRLAGLVVAAETRSKVGVPREAKAALVERRSA